jgi:ParE toxin of type II toxin-antitoxin system, parDE
MGHCALVEKIGVASAVSGVGIDNHLRVGAARDTRIADETESDLESLAYGGSRVKRRRGLLKLIHAQYLIHYRIQEQKKLVEIVAFGHGAQIK